MTNTATLQIRQLAYRQEKEILRDVTLDLTANQIYTVIGPSGAGKTTLLRILAGLLPPHIWHVDFRGGGLSAPRSSNCFGSPRLRFATLADG